MSKYTTELRYIIDSGYDIGLDKYPIFNESYRTSLNEKIIEHYSFREIGFETVGLFKRYLNRTMNEIMPYYNKLYLTELLEFQPLITVDLKKTYTLSDNKISQLFDVDKITGLIKFVENNTGTQENKVDDYSLKTLNLTDTFDTKNDVNMTNSINNIGNETNVQKGDNIRTLNLKNESSENGESTNIGVVKNSGTDTNLSTGTQNTDNNNDSTENLKSVFSDTPQGLLSMQNIKDELYATTATINDNEKNNISNELLTKDLKDERTLNLENNSETESKTELSRESLNTGTDKLETDSRNTRDFNTSTTNTQLGNTTQNGTNKNTGTEDISTEITDTKTINLQNKQDTNSTVDKENKKDSEENKTVEYSEHVIGFNGNKSYMELIKQFRESILNIDMLVIDELSNLFMGLW